MYHIEWQIFVIAILAEIIGTASGLGSSILFLPLAQYFESPATVLVLTGVLHVFANLFRVYLFWDRSSLKPFFKLAVIFFVTSALGALVSAGTDQESYRLALGVMLLVFVAARLAFSFHITKIFSEQKNSVMALSGFVSGWLGTGGSLRAMALSSMNLSKNEFILASSGIDLGGDMARTSIYLANGNLSREHLLYIPVLALSAWIGSRIGKKIVARISQNTFEKFTLIILALMGFSMLVGF